MLKFPFYVGGKKGFFKLKCATPILVKGQTLEKGFVDKGTVAGQFSGENGVEFQLSRIFW
jgi:hypothetical protein